MFFAPATFRRPYVANFQPSFLYGRPVDALHSLWADAYDGQRNSLSPHARASIDSDETSVTLSLDVPGLTREQMTIGIEGRVVRIASKDDAPRSFKAAYKLGSEIDPASSQAKLEHGVLTLKLGKIAPQSRESLLTIN